MHSPSRFVPHYVPHYVPQGSRSARGREPHDQPNMTYEVHARASRDARVAARLEERRRVAASTIRALRGKLSVQFVNKSWPLRTSLGICHSWTHPREKRRSCFAIRPDEQCEHSSFVCKVGRAMPMVVHGPAPGVGVLHAVRYSQREEGREPAGQCYAPPQQPLTSSLTGNRDARRCGCCEVLTIA